MSSLVHETNRRDQPATHVLVLGACAYPHLDPESAGALAHAFGDFGAFAEMASWLDSAGEFDQNQRAESCARRLFSKLPAADTLGTYVKLGVDHAVRSVYTDGGLAQLFKQHGVAYRLLRHSTSDLLHSNLRSRPWFPPTSH